MFSLAELARVHTSLREQDIDHLQRLVAAWGILSDLSFSDLLLYAPSDEPPSPGARSRGGRGPRRTYVVLAQVRPSTTQTVYRRDLVGLLTNDAERPLIDRSYRGGEAVTGQSGGQASGPIPAEVEDQLHLVAVPVRHDGRVIAVLSSEGLPSGGRRHGELEKAYLTTFDRFARMIALGEFPFAETADPTKELPRVGDGALLLDARGAVQYSSPNANSALHRLGVLSQVEGRSLGELDLDEAVVRQAMQSRAPATAELSRGTHNHVLAHCIPLLERKAPVGGLLLLRDISDLKRLDRLLVSKDTHIREIHHRVKNNLQTISSLLRIQARRLGSPEARTAIEESVRRIGSIAVVHETLSREAGDDVLFGEIARPIIRMVEESLVSPERPIYFRLSGDAITLPAPVATPLALVLTELLQNAVDHAYPGVGSEPGQVQVELRAGDGRLSVAVCDDGVGLPAGFTMDASTGLGLSIVRTLVEQELLGTITMRSRVDDVATDAPGGDQPTSGTIVLVDVPLDGGGTAR